MQLGELQTAYPRIRKAGATLVAISSSSPEDTAALAFSLGIRYPLLIDEELTTINRYRLAWTERDASVPATFVIDRHRNILFARVGTDVVDRPDADDLIRFLEERQAVD
jgi:peroxiredoxin